MGCQCTKRSKKGKISGVKEQGVKVTPMAMIKKITPNEEKKVLKEDDSRKPSNTHRFTVPVFSFLPDSMRNKRGETDSIKFEDVLEGGVKEQKFMIENGGGKKLTLKVKVECLNKEFDDLDEYVFSIRKPPQYDFNDTYFVMMEPMDFIVFTVAIKVPKLRTLEVLRGRIVVTDEAAKGKLEIQIVANVKSGARVVQKI